MTIPDYQTVMLPLLRILGDGQARPIAEVRRELAKHFGLSEEEREQPTPSGKSPLWSGRVGWARTYLKMAGLVTYVGRGVLRITPRGMEVLSENPSSLSVKGLKRFGEFKDWLVRSRQEQPAVAADIESESTPEERLELAFEEVSSRLHSEILEQIRSSSPAFFERLVVDLLVKMGYGGDRRDAAEAVGRSGDGGIDGIIKEDRLGLDVIYVQAKKWDGTVGRPAIQQFAGALQGKRARKGVFITTSTFSKDAMAYANQIDSHIVLIDGEQVARLMIDHGLGVTAVDTYEIKKLDSDYFNE